MTARQSTVSKWEQVLLSPDATLQDALMCINSAATRIALVVDARRRLLGTLSDGDIRRALLAGMGLSTMVEKCMFGTPTTAHIGETREEILSKMRRLAVHQIPVLDDQGCVVDLKTINDYLIGTDRENWVVIMAGGLGTRLKELTRDTPKPMLHLGNKPLLETVVGRFVTQGFRHIWLSVNYHAEQIERHFGNGAEFGANIRYLREGKRLGTAGALSLLPELPAGPVLVTNADLLVDIDYGQMLDLHIASDAAATVAVREFEYQIPYGVVHTREELIAGLEEKPMFQALINAGIYVLSPPAVAGVPRDTFYDMPELISQLVRSGNPARYFKIHGYWLDIGQHEDFRKATTDFPEVF